MTARTMTARYAGTCVECGQRFPAGAEIAWAGRQQAYHSGCFDGATEQTDYERGKQVERRDTDGTPLARTRYGWRRGYEHTGHRCIDAPCCGCCD